MFVDGGIYHVFCRVTRREPVFEDRRAAEVFVDQLAKIKARDEFVLFAWTLMSNHYHLLLRTVGVPLSRTMASLQVGFTKRFNRFHGLVGPFWQGRYQAILVQDQRYFDQLLAYIHLNPVTAGIVDDPALYEYSGHRELLGHSKLGIVDIGETLSVFDSSIGLARRRYTRALRGARDATWIGEAPGHLPWWSRAQPRVGNLVGGNRRTEVPFVDELGRSTETERPRIEAPDFVSRACRTMKWRLVDLTGPSQIRDVVRAREAIALVGFELYSIRLKDIANALHKNQDTASRWLSRGAQRRREDDGFARVVEILDERVSSADGEEEIDGSSD